MDLDFFNKTCRRFDEVLGDKKISEKEFLDQSDSKKCRNFQLKLSIARQHVPDWISEIISYFEKNDLVILEWTVGEISHTVLPEYFIR